MLGCTAVQTQKPNVAEQLKRMPQVPRPRGSLVKDRSPTIVSRAVVVLVHVVCWAIVRDKDASKSNVKAIVGAIVICRRGSACGCQRTQLYYLI